MFHPSWSHDVYFASGSDVKVILGKIFWSEMKEGLTDSQ